MDVTQLLNNYLEPYVQVSLGFKASNDTHRITINPSASQECNSATNNYSNLLSQKNRNIANSSNLPSCNYWGI